MPDRILLDACVLYPTVMREMLIGVAGKGAFTPLWSPRILEEWARAAVKISPEGETWARAEIALLRSVWPQAEIHPREGLEQRLYLPDENDIHVLAAAITGSADMIMTLNKKDFPRNTLAEEGLERVDPDGYLYTLWLTDSTIIEQVAQDVTAQARQLSGEDWTPRGLLKKARMPRLAKALA